MVWAWKVEGRREASTSTHTTDTGTLRPWVHTQKFKISTSEKCKHIIISQLWSEPPCSPHDCVPSVPPLCGAAELNTAEVGILGYSTRAKLYIVCPVSILLGNKGLRQHHTCPDQTRDLEVVEIETEN